MKTILSADWHIKLWEDTEVDDKGIPRKLNEIFSVIKDMSEYAKQNDIHQIIVAGDINDTKGIVHVRPFVLLKKIFEQYPDINYILLHGNHDSAGKKDVESAVQLLSGTHNVISIVSTVQIDNITYIPFSNHVAEDIEAAESTDIMISHFGLSDATLSSGISIKTGLSSKNLRKFKRVYLGHYHKPQVIENVTYIGDPIPLRRDEHNEQKRFIVLDTETLEEISVDTTGYRKYHEFVIEEDMTKTAIDKMSKEINRLREEGNYVLVRNRLKDMPAAIKKIENVTVVDEYQEEYEIRGITTAMSMEEQMRKYLMIERIPEEEIEEYIRIGLETISDA